MGILERGQQMEIRKTYLNVWQTSLMDTMKVNCAYWCFASCCPPCVSYMLRKRALRNEMSRYQCCAGYMPCSGKCMEEQCPEFCLCLEVYFCFNNSVASTRFLLQDEFNIQTTACDNCLIAFMIILGQLACICHCIACIVGSDEIRDIAELLSLISDLVQCTVCACMQTQHKVEMDYRFGANGAGSLGVMVVPPVQSMSRFDKSVPPSVEKPNEPGPKQSSPQEQPQYAPYPPGPYPQYAPYPPPQQQGQWPQHPPPYGYGYPPQYMPGYTSNSSPPPGYSSSGYPPHPPGYYPPANPPPPQNFAFNEHPTHPPPSAPPPETTKDSK